MVSTGTAGIQSAMKGIALLNLYLAVLESGVPSASPRRKPMGAPVYPLLQLWSIVILLGEA